jgi:hypothetical protein
MNSTNQNNATPDIRPQHPNTEPPPQVERERQVLDSLLRLSSAGRIDNYLLYIEMKKPTLEQIEAVSRLLEACRLCGASFKTGKTTWIKMPDDTVFHIRERQAGWALSWLMPDHCGSLGRVIPKSSTARQIQKSILELHLKILENFSCDPEQKS